MQRKVYTGGWLGQMMLHEAGEVFKMKTHTEEDCSRSPVKCACGGVHVILNFRKNSRYLKYFCFKNSYIFNHHLALTDMTTWPDMFQKAKLPKANTNAIKHLSCTEPCKYGIHFSNIWHKKTEKLDSNSE